MNRNDAIRLLNEALSRMKKPSPNANGGSIEAGGIYWRLVSVLKWADKISHEEAKEIAKKAGLVSYQQVFRRLELGWTLEEIHLPNQRKCSPANQRKIVLPNGETARACGAYFREHNTKLSSERHAKRRAKRDKRIRLSNFLNS